MNIKTKIKNDLWRWNYILPFVKRHQFDENGKISVLRHVFEAYCSIHPVRSKEKTIGYDIKSLLAAVEISFDEKSRFVYFVDTTKTIAVPGNILSNFTFDYNLIIHGTFKEICDRALGEDDYGREASAVIDGIYSLRQRIIDTLSEHEAHSNVKEKSLIYFSRMFEERAEHFEEALQRILFFNQILWQTRHRLNGLGRLDKILDDLYKRDMETGYLNISVANEIVFDFLRQLSRFPEYKSDALLGDIGQIIVLGGKEMDGSYFCNDLTQIFMQQQAELKKPDPKTLLRVSEGMPIDLLQVAVECLLRKTGSPLFSNDDVVIPSLLEFGMPSEDAHDYCTSACWEPYIVGKSLDQNNIAVFDYFIALEEILKEHKIFTTYDELVEQYILHNTARFKSFLEELNTLKWAKDPLVSMFTMDCNSKRLDISEGAAVYNNYGITTVALANVVDSLLNIKELIYTNHVYDFEELNRDREDNYCANSDVYMKLRSLKKHYGHDEDDSISLVNRITKDLSEVAKTYRNSCGGTVKFGVSSPGYNMLAKKTSADFAGRKAGMPYNTHISCMDAAYTELISFAAKIDVMGQRFNGNVVDFFTTPNFLSENKQKFVSFLKSAIDVGFFQLQMNVMDSKTLIDAKKNPEKYAGLIVRVWGFSAYFNELPESYKDLLIERAIAAERV